MPTRFRCKVNLNTIREVKQPRSAEEIVKWRDGYRMAALVIFIYALWLIAFWQYQTRFGRPY